MTISTAAWHDITSAAPLASNVPVLRIIRNSSKAVRTIQAIVLGVYPEKNGPNSITVYVPLRQKWTAWNEDSCQINLGEAQGVGYALQLLGGNDCQWRDHTNRGLVAHGVLSRHWKGTTTDDDRIVISSVLQETFGKAGILPTCLPLATL